MKTVLIALTLTLFMQQAWAQDVDVRVKPNIKVNPDIKVNTDIKMDLKTMAKTLAKDITQDLDMDLDIDFGDDFDDDDDHRGQYEQSSQEVDIPLSKPGERGVLKVDSRNGRIKVTGYDGASVKVKIIKYSKKVSRSSDGGMRLVSSGGFNFEASEYNNTVKVENEGWNNRADFEIMVPKNFDVKAESYNNGHIEIEGVNGEMDIESYNGPITLTDIGGSASASTYNGAVKVSFTSVTADVPMTFNTYNGDVDITVPDGTKFSTKMRTNRDIFTDFEAFSLSDPKPTTNSSRSENRRGYSIKYENWVQGDLNGGGSEVIMKTRNGNIYIRKR